VDRDRVIASTCSLRFVGELVGLDGLLRNGVDGGLMAKELGFFLTALNAQYIRPSVSKRLVDEVRFELGYLDITRSTKSDPDLVRVLRQTIPREAIRVARRSSECGGLFAEHYERLRQDLPDRSDRMFAYTMPYGPLLFGVKHGRFDEPISGHEFRCHAANPRPSLRRVPHPCRTAGVRTRRERRGDPLGPAQLPIPEALCYVRIY